MQVGDLIRHIVHNGRIGIITMVVRREVKVLWYNGDHSWTLTQRVEVIDESR